MTDGRFVHNGDANILPYGDMDCSGFYRSRGGDRNLSAQLAGNRSESMMGATQAVIAIWLMGARIACLGLWAGMARRGS